MAGAEFCRGFDSLCSFPGNSLELKTVGKTALPSPKEGISTGIPFVLMDEIHFALFEPGLQGSLLGYGAEVTVQPLGHVGRLWERAWEADLRVDDTLVGLFQGNRAFLDSLKLRRLLQAILHLSALLQRLWTYSSCQSMRGCLVQQPNV